MSFDLITMTVTTPIARMITAEESSAIAYVKVEGLNVTIAYQSNPDNMYSYTADPEFAQQLVQILEAEDLAGISLGSTLSDARRVGDLTEAV